ncbi:MAG: hypothetical protein QGG09_18770, partial [Pirellulaceae bacterium]|nr:hypothetical protein [Pirellulaceae bacterium]
MVYQSAQTIEGQCRPTRCLAAGDTVKKRCQKLPYGGVGRTGVSGGLARRAAERIHPRSDVQA